MDKNSLIGFLLIGAILFGFFMLNKPSEQELAQQKRYRDSIALVSKVNQEAQQSAVPVADVEKLKSNPSDSSVIAVVNEKYGEFAPAILGEEKFFTIENKNLRVVLSSHGAAIKTIEVKNFKTWDKKPLFLAENSDMDFGFNFFTPSNRQVNTKDLYFEILPVSTSSKATFRVSTSGGAHLDFVYSIPADSNIVNFELASTDLRKIVGGSAGSMDLNWKLDLRRNEKSKDFEKRYSGLYYKFNLDKVEDITFGKNVTEKNLTTKVKWIGFKEQFFSAALISESAFPNSLVKTIPNDNDNYLATLSADVAVPIDENGAKLSFYFGPNHYTTLKKAGNDLQKMINIGWVGYSWVNRWLVIPLFNWLSKSITNYGLIILLLTLVVKLIIFPFTYKSYISTAKMRLLKPQIEEINAKIPAEKTLERQQATMALYRKVGVSPMGGCLPMLFQMPFLIALFSFFPSSIELRQQSFLWANDLSSYDAIITWSTQIPLISSFYGNHVSLFCLLMTIVNIVYTMMNQEMTASSQQMPGMKTMMYMMPVMFLFIFNNYASGLSYYYFLSTLITIGQTYLMRRFVDEKSLMAQLEANKKKVVTKSKWQQRIEKMQQDQKAFAREQAKKRK